MKIIHTADLHLESKLQSNLSKEKAKQIRDELKQNFAILVQTAKDDDVDIIILAGDIFDKNTVSPSLKSFFLSIIENAPNITFLYVPGNHDENVFYAMEYPKNLIIFSDKWEYFDFKEVIICGRTIKQTNDDRIFQSLHLDSKRLNIAILHGEIVSGNAQSVDFGISLNLLYNKGIDYLALGHIHGYSKGRIDDRGIYCYSGALAGRGFDELNEKGYVLLEIENGKIFDTFIPFSKREYKEVNVNISNCFTELEIINEIEKIVKNINSNNLLKIVLTGDCNLQANKDLDYIEKQFEQNFFFVKIVDKTKLKIDIEKLKGDISLKGEFIRLVLNQDLTEQEKTDIITLGIKALEGDEI